jgi:hypothetical protein
MCGMPRGLRGGRRKADALASLIARDGDSCWYCSCLFVPGKRFRTIDHAIPLSLGGTNAFENLRLACGRCNALKGATTAVAIGVARRERRRHHAPNIKHDAALTTKKEFDAWASNVRCLMSVRGYRRASSKAARAEARIRRLCVARTRCHFEAIE